MWRLVKGKHGGDRRRKVQPGDTEVTLQVQDDPPLEDKYTLLTYAFGKIVQGSSRWYIEDFSLVTGTMRLVVGDGGKVHPRGRLNADLRGVTVEQHKLGAKE